VPELTLDAHEIRSEGRYEHLKHLITHKADNTMSEKDHVTNIFKSDGHSGEGGLASALPLLLAGGARRNDDGFGGAGGLVAGGLGGLVLGSLLNGRNGGLLGGGGGDCGNGAETRLQTNADTLAILNAVNNSVTATNAGTAKISSDIQTQTFQIAQGLTNLNDSISLVNQNVSSQGCQTREWVSSDGEKTRALLVSRFQLEDATKIAEQNARIVALETRSHADHLHATNTLSITNTNTAVAAQAQRQDQDQRQSQFQALVGELNRLNCEIAHTKQIATATNQNIIAGNTGAVVTGPQAANPTNVNTR